MKTAWRLSMCLSLVLGLALLGPAVPRAQAQSCTELIADGGFETGDVWLLGVTPLTPEYVTYTSHSGNRSLAMGITRGGNAEGYSSARQTVTIPLYANQVTLSFWVNTMVVAPAGADRMQLVLLNPDGSTLAVPWSSSNDSRMWNQLSFDLTRWRGRTVQVYFNVYNDGVGGTAGMFLDDVSLTACSPGVTVVPTGTAMPTVWPTTTPTVLPTSTPGCVNAVVNGEFTSGLASWQTVGDPAGVALVTNPVHSTPYAVQLGSVTQNLNGLASIRQLVTIPVGYPQATLGVWVYTISQSSAGADYQEVALLNSSGGTMFMPWRVQANNQAWSQLLFDVSPFIGQTVFVSLSVNNDGAGGRTAMVVDDVRLLSCVPGPGVTTPTPTGTPLPTSAPTVTGTPPPTLTPAPPGCFDLLRNGSFEAGFADWFVPNNPIMPQIVASPVVSAVDGVYAAQMGSQVQNASSYSSARQWVTIPWTHPRVVIQYWAYTWAESLTGADQQQLVLLAPGDQVLAVPWRALEDDRYWQSHDIDITGMTGPTFAVYFNVINDGAGGRTAMFIDDVRLWACTPGANPSPMPMPLAVAAAESAEAVAKPVIAAAQSADATAGPIVAAVQSVTATVRSVAATAYVEGTPLPELAERAVATGIAAETPPANLTRVSVTTPAQMIATSAPTLRATATPSASRQSNQLWSNLTPWLQLGLVVVLVASSPSS